MIMKLYEISDSTVSSATKMIAATPAGGVLFLLTHGRSNDIARGSPSFE
jgi:hypothetical protein